MFLLYCAYLYISFLFTPEFGAPVMEPVPAMPEPVEEGMIDISIWVNPTSLKIVFLDLKCDALFMNGKLSLIFVSLDDFYSKRKDTLHKQILFT